MRAAVRAGCAGMLGISLLLVSCSSLRLAETHDVTPAPPPSHISLPLEVEWTYDAGAAFGPEPLAVVGTHVLVGTRRGEVHALRSSTGKSSGKHEFGHSVEGRPVVIGGILIAPVKTGGAGVQALDLATGRTRWRSKGAPVEAGLASTDDVVFAGDAEGGVTAFKAASGDVAWTVELKGPAILSSPLYDTGALYVIDRLGWLSVLNPQTGLVEWEVDLELPVQNAPSPAGHLLIVPTTRGHVVAVDRRDRHVGWRYEATSKHARFSTPAIAQDVVVAAASDGIVRGLDVATGELHWERDLGAAVTARPFVVGSSVLIGTMDGMLFHLDAASGRVLGEQQLRGRIKSAMIADADGLVVAVEPRHVVRYAWQRP